MKPGLKISLLCNLCLAGILVFALTRRPEKTATLPSVTEPQSSAAPLEPEPFQWTRIESTNDYRDYVANLRSIGCPEPTVEDIVWGDADRAFANQRQQLHLTGDEPGPWSNQREIQLVAFFLGQTLPASGPEPEKNPAKAAPDPKSAPAVYPLAFKDVNLDKLGLTDAQKQGVKQAIAGIRQQFIDQLGGPNQDPNDPAYLARWRKAQPQMDAELRGWLGGKTFMAYQLAAQARTTTTP